MGGVTTRNMQSSLQKYNKLYRVVSCWTIINIRHVCLSVRLSVRPSAWNNSAPTERIFIKFDI